MSHQLSVLYDNNSINALRDPTLSSTLFGDQPPSSNPSSISTSLDDSDLFDIPPSKGLHMTQDPLLVSPLLSYVSSPISSDDSHSVVVSPVTNNQTITDQDNNIPQRRYNNTSSGSPNIDNVQQRLSPSSNLNVSMTSSRQNSYGSINNINNSRPRPISSSNSDANSHISSSNINLSATLNKTEQGSTGSSSADSNKTFSVAQRHSPSAKLITSQPVSHHSYASFFQNSMVSSIDGSSISQPRRSSTSTIIPSQSQNEQYRSINISSLGQGNIPSSRPMAQLRRSSTSNLVTTKAYCPINVIDKSKLAYIPVTTTQYPVDGYSLVGHVSSGEVSSTPFSKYHPIQPKAGVAMSDVYSDPALDGLKGSKKRVVSTSIDAKLTKRRVSKPSDDSITEASVAVMPTDLSSSEAENRNEADVYPYRCVIPGCPKVYKNANGLKYHNEHGHASQSGNREKPWACHIGSCLKTYGSKGGLIYHVKRCHPNDLWALP